MTGSGVDEDRDAIVIATYNLYGIPWVRGIELERASPTRRRVEP